MYVHFAPRDTNSDAVVGHGFYSF